MRLHPSLLSPVLLGLALLGHAAHADGERSAYACSLSPDATLGLWSVWETAANELLLTATLAPDAGPTAIRLYNLEFAWDAARLQPVGPPQVGDLFTGRPETWFGHFDSSATRTVTETLLGDVTGVTPTQPVTLFRQLFHAIGPEGGPTLIDLVSLTLRGPDNEPIPVTATGQAHLQIDVTPPQGYAFDLWALNPAGNQLWTAQPLVACSLAPGDGSLAGLVLNESAILPANSDAAWMPPPAPATFMLSPGDGHKMVRAWLRDAYGNRAVLLDSITLDATAPGHAMQLTARPRHQAVQLNWLNPTQDFARVRIYRRGWSDTGVSRYPEYDDIDPMSPYPESEGQAQAAGFTLAYEGAGQSWLDAVAPRDVYRYVAFCLDAADNVGPGDAEARDRSTNYLLGDTWQPWDGIVFVRDLVRLAGAYSTVEGAGAYRPELDFGPTDDHSREGIPLTDNLVGFEDLMIFAMNYGPAGPVLDARPAKGSAPAAGDALAMLRMERIGQEIALRLEDATDWLGLHLLLRWDTPARALATPTSGEALICQDGPGRLLLDRVLLPGEDPAAELARLSFADGPPAGLRVAELQLRGAANQPLAIAADEEAARPRGLAFQGAFPNPFNPETTLRFTLPAAAEVDVEIYNALGQRVRRLQPGRLEAGTQTLRFSGEGLASGLYLLELRAGGERRMGRVLLLR